MTKIFLLTYILIHQKCIPMHTWILTLNISRDCKTLILQWNLGLTFTNTKKKKWNELTLHQYYYFGRLMLLFSLQSEIAIVWPGYNVDLFPLFFVYCFKSWSNAQSEFLLSTCQHFLNIASSCLSLEPRDQINCSVVNMKTMGQGRRWSSVEHISNAAQPAPLYKPPGTQGHPC